MPRKECVTLYLDAGDVERWRRLCAATKVPTSLRQREALHAALDRLEREHSEALAALPRTGGQLDE